MSPGHGPTASVPALEGRREPWMDAVLAAQAWLNATVATHGSPVHLLHPPTLLARHAELRQAALDLGVDVQVLFARKANRADAFVRAAARDPDLGVDTASLGELDACVRAGVPGHRLVVTGAVKPDPLLRRALEVGATVVVDNAQEARRLRSIAAALRHTNVGVALRVSGFTFRGEVRYSRFGVDLTAARRFVAEELGTPVVCEGLHFHLDGYSRTERGAALHQCLDLAAQLAEDGVEVSSIDIGGGLRVGYLDDPAQWDAFWHEHRRALLGARPSLTFGGDPLGLTVEDGQVTGTPNVYPFAEQRPGPLFLRDVLDHADDEGRTAADRLRAAGVQLRLEPGRALLDGAGLTVARVQHTKTDSNGDLLVGLELNSTQHGSSSADILVDPILLPVAGGHRDGPTTAFLTGSYCTEGDLVLRRRVPLSATPRRGDLLVFVNTAGYFMHFRATDGHGFGRAADVVVDVAEGRGPRGVPDADGFAGNGRYGRAHRRSGELHQHVDH